jgi:small subunit ribosomal protein S19
MSRARWKGPYFASTLLKNIKPKKNKRIWSRNSTIPAIYVDKAVYVHNGQFFTRVDITRDKVGYKFGAFAKTRKHTSKRPVHRKKVKKTK